MRLITRPRYQKAIEQAREQYDPEIYARRQVVAEWVLAEAKGWHGLARAQFRGVDKMTIQSLMTASVQNLKRLVRASNLAEFGLFAVLKALWKSLAIVLRRSRTELRAVCTQSDPSAILALARQF